MQHSGQEITAEAVGNLAGINAITLFLGRGTGDRKIHYLTGVAQGSPESVLGEESLTLEVGEYAVVGVNEAALLRDTQTWLLVPWLANSGRREKNAPQFERYISISEAGTPIGPVEIWIPLEPLAGDLEFTILPALAECPAAQFV